MIKIIVFLFFVLFPLQDFMLCRNIKFKLLVPILMPMQTYTIYTDRRINQYLTFAKCNHAGHSGVMFLVVALRCITFLDVLGHQAE